MSSATSRRAVKTETLPYRPADELSSLIAQIAVILTASKADGESQPSSRPMPTRVLLTVEEAAKRLGIGKTKAYSLVMAGDLESVQIGRLRRIHTDSVNEYAARLVAEHNGSKCRNAAVRRIA